MFNYIYEKIKTFLEFYTKCMYELEIKTPGLIDS